MTGYASKLSAEIPGKPELAERIERYLDRFGFQCDGAWYARATWLGAHWQALFEKMGIMRRAGNRDDLKTMGIEIPPSDDKPTAVFYRFDPEAASRLQTH